MRISVVGGNMFSLLTVRRFLCVLLPLTASCVGCGTASLDSAAIDLRTATIEVCATNESTQVALEELSRHVELACGIKPSVVTSNGVFVIGRAPNGDKPTAFESNAARRGDRVYFWGDDGVRRLPHGGFVKVWGSAFGVYGFLEKALGVRWVMPGDDGIVIARASCVDLPSNWAWSSYPSLEKSEIRLRATEWGLRYEAAKVPSALRLSEAEIAREDANRRRWLLRQRIQMRDPYAFGHAFGDWQKRFEKTHPDYIAVDQRGRRGCEPGRERFSQQCLSNPAVQDQMIADWVAAGKPKRLNLCLNDSWFHCRCSNCCGWDADKPGERFELHKTDRVLRFYNIMCEKAQKHRPDVDVCAYAYLDFRLPPRRERIRYPDRLVLAFVPMIYDDFTQVIADWKDAGLVRFLVRPNYLCYNGFTPRGYERQFFEEFRAQQAMGMIGRDEGSFNRGTIQDFETYAFARAIADSSVDFETVENEFLSQYGVAVEAMKRYYLRVRARGEKERNEKRRNRRLDLESATTDDGQFYDASVSGHTVADLQGDLVVLDHAQAMSGLTAIERRRISRVRTHVELAIYARRLWEACEARDSIPKDPIRIQAVRTACREMMDFACAHAAELRDHWWLLLTRPSYVGKAFQL